MTEWLKDHPGLMVSGGLSVALLIAGVVVAPIAVARLPVDFLTQENHRPSVWQNVAGWALIVAGVAMMILPGPGAVALVAGVVLADFPGKRRFLRWFFSLGKIFEGMNRIRRERGKVALKKP